MAGEVSGIDRLSVPLEIRRGGAHEARAPPHGLGTRPRLAGEVRALRQGGVVRRLDDFFFESARRDDHEGEYATESDGAALLASDPFDGPGIEANGQLRFNTAPGLGLSLRREG